MKIYFYISVAASALSLLLAIVLFWIGGTNQSLQAEVQKAQVQLQVQQQEIQRPQAIAQRLTNPMLQEMAAYAGKDDKIRELLEKNGLKYTPPSPTPSAASPAPKPAAHTETPSLQP